MNLLLKSLSKTFFSQFARRCANLFFVFVLCANLTAAISIEQYRKNLAEAKIALENLQDEYLTADEADFARAAKQVERLIPARQTIETADKTSVETDNGWLAAELETIEATAAVDDKLIEINFVVERIAAVENRVVELETAQTAAAKADDKQALNEILRRAEYQKAPQEREKSVLQRISDGFSKWLDEFFRWLFGNRAPSDPVENAPAPNLSAIGKVLQYAVIALAVAVIGFVFWRFVLPLFGGERRAGKSKRKEPRVILGETLAADETADNLLLEAERLARGGDARAAIRKGYIAVLCELHDRKLLALARHKTNLDYLRDIERKRATIFQPMRFLTNSFERHWYGEAAAGERDWQEFREQFNVINQR